jgi:hypothetical protein
MLGFIITELKDRVIFLDTHDTISLTTKEYNLLTGDSISGTGWQMNLYYKGYNNKQLCVNDFIASGKIKRIDFTNLSVAQVENLLKL